MIGNFGRVIWLCSGRVRHSAWRIIEREARRKVIEGFGFGCRRRANDHQHTSEYITANVWKALLLREKTNIINVEDKENQKSRPKIATSVTDTDTGRHSLNFKSFEKTKLETDHKLYRYSILSIGWGLKLPQHSALASRRSVPRLVTCDDFDGALKEIRISVRQFPGDFPLI